MKRSIIIPRGLQKDICRIFGLSQFGAWKALNYESNSPRAYKVRKYALENGGRYEEEGLTPNCKIYTSLYGMIFTFHSGYTVAYNSLLKRINVFINGKLVDAHDDADLDLLLSTIQSTLQLSEGDINPPIKNSTKR
jgi:hypothetical protein